MKAIGKISHQVFILSVTTFLFYVTQGSVWPFLNLYIYQTSQGDYFLTALITAIPAFIAIFSVGFWGWGIDKLKNNRVFAMIGVLSSALLYFLGIQISDAFLFFLTYSALCFFMNAFYPAYQSYVSLQSEQSDRAFSNVFAIASLGYFFGAIISGIVYDLEGMIILFQLAFILLILTGIIGVFGFKREKMDTVDNSEQYTVSNWKTVLKNPIVPILCIIVFFSQFSMMIANAYFSVYITEIGGGSFIVGSSIAVATLLGAFLLPFFGRFSEKIGRKPFIIFTVGGFGIAGIIVYSIPSPVIVGYIWGAMPFYTGILAGGYALLSDACQKSDQGKAMGLFNAAFSLGN
ncbi:MAG: MFS transporter, partial [Candidatus Hodarchaeota archaeon]